MDNMTKIRRIYANYYNGGDNEKTCSELAELPVDALAEFISDAFSRGWIDRYQIGVSEDGELI